MIKVVTAAGTQCNHMTTSVGYASSSHGPVHFGLGGEKAAKVVEIRWPSGIVQTLKDVAGDRVGEGEGSGGKVVRGWLREIFLQGLKLLCYMVLRRGPSKLREN